ncbi:S-adenosyl-L-methionine-dependent methyltransferase [Dunaliella salina]|uniref:tRNA (adenine(58)-N(1))-methyltransferase n=1 Tax=Dunaliella salina TaxID=3046 RepID=A0ABQ7H734_DUNSA|nr:S-adenosyl-L-methionine-dependent methyltransferase [Dunaliella salina]|eukprot:KAF5842670.1 S-adenosyl-L-methionine-dependent methyltransferase [Dunaliella salina]
MLPSLTPAQGQPRIQDKSLVIVYESINSMKAVHVDAKARYDNRYGSFLQKDWIGLPFGSKVRATGGSRGWVYLLAPTPDLWSLVLRHRTQILYIADISMVCMYLELCPGAVVLESGTGSGSLTHSLARAVAPSGHVYSFEHHLERANEADAEVRSNGLAPCVTIRHRDVEGCGFPCGQGRAGEGGQAQGSAATSGRGGDGLKGDGKPGEADGSPACGGGKEEGRSGVQGGESASQQQERDSKEDGSGAGRDDELNLAGKADAVFLDLPAPPKVIPSAAICLKPNGRLCSFSPCIEQVQKVCRALELAGFTDILTIECLLRTHEVRAERMETLKRPPPSAQQHQQEHLGNAAKRARMGAKQDYSQSADAVPATGADAAGPKQEGMDGDAANGDEEGGQEEEAAGVQSPGACAPSEDYQKQNQGNNKDRAEEEGPGEEAEGLQGSGVHVPVEGGQEEGQGGRQSNAGGQQGSGGGQAGVTTMVSSCPAQQARGHTGYLTFGRKWAG